MLKYNKETIFLRNAAISLIIIISVLFFVLENASALIGIKEGDTPKPIILNDLNGRTVDASQSFGKRPVIIVFWELTTDKSFLNYSLDELRFLNEFYSKYHAEKNLEIFAIFTPEEEKNVTESEMAALQDLIKVNRIQFPVLIDSGFEIFREYGVIALPSTVMVDMTGRIMFIYPSFPLAAQPVISKKIDELVGIRAEPEIAAVALEPADTQAARLYRYSLQMYKKGLLEQAVSPLRKSLELDPDSALSHNLLGIILWKRSEHEHSAEEFSRAIALDEKNSSPHFNYGLQLFERGDLEKALPYLKTAVALDDNLAEGHYVLGLIYRQQGMQSDASREFIRSLELFGQRKPPAPSFDSSTYHSVSALFALSDMYGSRQENEKALEMLQKAVRITLGIKDGGDEHIYKCEDLMIYE